MASTLFVGNGTPSVGHTLTVSKTFVGGATGTVTGTLAGSNVINCGANCSAVITPGDTVTLTAVPAAGYYLGKWGGECTGTTGLTCTITVDSAKDVQVTFTPANIVFATKTTKTPAAWGGPANADAQCNMIAAAAGHPGTYVAWMSRPGVNARDRLGAASGWVRVDGKPFAESRDTLINDFKMFYPVLLDENGNSGGTTFVVTGSHPNGTVALTCNDWTDSSTSQFFGYGQTDTGVGHWSGGNATSCSSLARIYCFQTDYDAFVTVPPMAGRRAFLSNNGVPGSAGIAGADAECASSASSIGLAGTFRALLATSSASAASRFSASGPPWVRVDDVPLTATAAELFVAAPKLLAHLDVTASRKYLNDPVWAGSTSVTTAGTAATTCQNWTTALSTAQAQVGTPSYSGINFFGGYPIGCDQMSRVYCLQE
jgi:hypothetical protein